MEYDDYKRLYETLDKYNEEIINGKKIYAEAIEWKIPNLLCVLPKHYKIRSIAEVGCFTGDIVANIYIEGSSPLKTGYDVNSIAINAAKEKYPNVKFSTNDVIEVDEQYDLIILSDIIEHICEPEEFLKNLSKKTNVLLINLPLERCWSNLFRKYGTNDPSGHLRSYNYQEANVLFSDGGWKIDNYIIKWFCETDTYKANSLNKLSIKEIIRKSFLKSKYLRRRYFPSNLFALLIRDEK